MSALTETQIWQALKSRVATLPVSPVAIIYPGSLYAPVAGTEFIAVSKVTVEPARVLIKAGKNLRRGSLMVTRVQPLGQDFAVYEQAGAVIASHFAEDTQMRYGNACVRVTSAPHVMDGYRDAGWWRTPVSIPWESFA